jgi:hypothetical protein
MKVFIHRRQPATVADRLREAGLIVEAQMLLDPHEDVPGRILFARRPT